MSTLPITPSVDGTSQQTRVRPSARVMSMHRWTRAEVLSVQTSRAGRPTTSSPDRHKNSGLASSKTWAEPLNRARTAIGWPPNTRARIGSLRPVALHCHMERAFHIHEL